MMDLKKIAEVVKMLYLIFFGKGKDSFFAKMVFRGDAVTYDDVKLKTGKSKVMPDDVSLTTRFSKNVPLLRPLVSAAMDTVTTAKLAIEMAKLGGLGIIHKAMTIKQQASEVATVKKHQHGRIIREDLVVVGPNFKMGKLFELKEKFGFSTFPVVNKTGKLVGVIFGKHFRYHRDPEELVKNVMDKLTKSRTKSKIETAPSDIEPIAAFNFMNDKEINFLPLVDKQKILTGLFTHKDLERDLSGQSTNNVDKNGQLRVGAAVGTGDSEKSRVAILVENKVDVIVIDTAHGDSEPVFAMVKFIKENYPQVDVVAGNVSEPESARRLCELGIDGLKVGQGPGSICTTRIVAGVGCPQVTAIYNCVKVAQEYGVPVCADGGIKYSGDIPIAIGAGADCVMVGNVLAGTDETPGEVMLQEGRQWKIYRGMGSIDAMIANPGAADRYYQGGKDINMMIAEGIVSRVPYKGRLAGVIYQLVGGLRDGMGYVGAATIQELQAKGDFYRISPQGQQESHPHDVFITKEAPNYQTN